MLKKRKRFYLDPVTGKVTKKVPHAHRSGKFRWKVKYVLLARPRNKG